MIDFARRMAINAATKGARFVFDRPNIVKAKKRHQNLVQSGVVEVHAGDLKFANGRFAIYLIWQPQGIRWFVQNALDAFRMTQTNVIVIANHSLNKELLEQLKPHCREILVRNNEGFDVGGYRDGTMHVLERFSPTRLIYLNDSVYLFKDGLTELFSRLATSEADICTAFENWEFRYHIQSFCFSVSQHIIDTDAFANFWRNYIPANSRRWAIHKGEIGFSEAVVPYARSFEVVFDPTDLRDPLSKLSMEELRSLNTFLPFTQRTLPNESISNSQMVDEIIARVASRSQIHTGGFLYSRFLKNPLVKRDLVYRMQFSLYDVEHCIRACSNAENINDILSEMRRKGRGDQMPLLKRIQFMDGII